MKICGKCGESKELCEFGKQSKSLDGLKNYCKDCIKKINRARYLKNRKKHIEKVKEWQNNNLEKVQGYRLAYKNKHEQE